MTAIGALGPSRLKTVIKLAPIAPDVFAFFRKFLPPRRSSLSRAWARMPRRRTRSRKNFRSYRDTRCRWGLNHARETAGRMADPVRHCCEDPRTRQDHNRPPPCRARRHRLVCQMLGSARLGFFITSGWYDTAQIKGQPAFEQLGSQLDLTASPMKLAIVRYLVYPRQRSIGDSLTNAKRRQATLFAEDHQRTRSNLREEFGR